MFFSFLIKQIFLLISYISNINSFPKPLSSKEEEEVLVRYEQGDAQAKNILIERNLRLVAHVAKKYTTTGREPDDLISIGTIGLIKGVSSYNRSKGTKLSTYIARCIENEILMCIRASKKMQNEVSIEEPIGFDYEGNQITFNDILYNDDSRVIDEVDSKISIAKLYQAINTRLSLRERMVIQMRYGLGGTREMTQKEVAKKLNISRSYISRIEKKAIQLMSKDFVGWQGD